ncbi:MAG: hypothetical protein AB1726_12785 [Planctomycetota bacterium]
MRKLYLAVWFLLPVALGAYHLGPGQDRLRIDDAARSLEEAAAHAARAAALPEEEAPAAAAEWARAVQAYTAALRDLPADRVSAQRAARLELARCRMFVAGLPEANAELQSLVEEMAADEGADPALLRDARRALAGSQYYLTWLMRLEGVGREEWEPVIEAARQTYKLLAEEDAAGADEEGARRSREDLESAIRLARMELNELQGLPLPSQ